MTHLPSKHTLMRLAATAVMLVAWLAAMPQLALNGIQPVRDTRYGWLLMPLTAEQWSFILL